MVQSPAAAINAWPARIRQRLNVRTAGAVRPVSEITSTSVEAYRLFALGVEAATNVRTKDAVKSLSEAIRSQLSGLHP